MQVTCRANGNCARLLASQLVSGFNKRPGCGSLSPFLVPFIFSVFVLSHMNWGRKSYEKKVTVVVKT